MPSKPPRAYPAESVMTRPWYYTTILDGELPAAKFISTTLECKLLSLASTPVPQHLPALSQQAEKSGPDRLSSHAIIQVRKLPDRRVLALFVLLIMVTQPVMSKPWTNMQPDHVIFRSRICQPVLPDNLSKMLGANMDERRMASSMAAGKRTFPYSLDDPGNSDFQGDEPRYGLAVDSADIVENEWGSEEGVFMESEDDIYTDNSMVEELSDKEVVERRTWLPRRKVLNRRMPDRTGRKRYRKNNKNDLNDEEFFDLMNTKSQSITSESYPYHRRWPRSSIDEYEPLSRPVFQEGGNPSIEEETDDTVIPDEYEIEEENNDIDSKDKKSTDNIVPLRLFLSGKNKKMRRQLKKKFRQKSTNLNKPPPWECKFVQSHKRMQKGIFPDILLDGRCLTDKCFYRLYNCEPIKYAVKLLQRDPDQCNPLPSVTNITVYEEKWNLKQHHVTVGCSCSSPNVKSSKPKNRRRD